jgi:hypothetical protein
MAEPWFINNQLRILYAVLHFGIPLDLEINGKRRLNTPQNTPPHANSVEHFFAAAVCQSTQYRKKPVLTGKKASRKPHRWV